MWLWLLLFRWFLLQGSCSIYHSVDEGRWIVVLTQILEDYGVSLFVGLGGGEGHDSLDEIGRHVDLHADGVERVVIQEPP